MGQYNAPDAASGSGIKVLDRAVLILTTIADQPRSLAELCQATKLPRATAHRLATALETHRMLSRTADGRWSIGSALTSLGSGSSDTLIDAATPIMNALMQRTGESVQLYRLTGTSRTCIASKEPPSGLQNTVPVGSRMPLTAGSSAHVFMAYAPPTLQRVRSTGYAESVSEREPGLASLSAPVFDHTGNIVAVLSISGPAERLRPHPGARWATELIDAAKNLGAAL